MMEVVVLGKKVKTGEGEEKMLEGSVRALERKSVWPISEGR